MQLTEGQKQAVAMVDRLMKADGAAFGVLTGYAGTGKTTLLRVLADAHGDPVVLTPTGKAALRVKEATDLEASTIHRWMKVPKEDSETGEVKYVNRPLEMIDLPTNHLVVVDEASMVAAELWGDLWTLCSSLGIKVLLVGDPFQLPPVAERGKLPFCALDLRTAHRVALTEVVRQALDSPVIRAASLIRESEEGTMEALTGVLPGMKERELVQTFAHATDPDAETVRDCTMLAHRNVTRHALNHAVRRALGRDSRDVVVGEPLLVTANNYRLYRFNGEVLGFNGWSSAPGEPVAVRDRRKNVSAMMTFGIATVDARPVVMSPEEVFAQTGGLERHVIAKEARRHVYGEGGYEDLAHVPSHLNAELGYCLTTHKAQGSEWREAIVVLEPSVDVYSVDGRRWLYTAVTRAKVEATVCPVGWDFRP